MSNSDEVRLQASAVPYSSVVGAAIQLHDDTGAVVAILGIHPQGPYADSHMRMEASLRIQQIVMDALEKR